MSTTVESVGPPTYYRSETELLSLDEVAEQLRVSRWQVYQLINRGQLRTVHIGRRRLVAASDLGAYIATVRDQGGRQ